jgi:hypothetical protein
MFQGMEALPCRMGTIWIVPIYSAGTLARVPGLLRSISWTIGLTFFRIPLTAGLFGTSKRTTSLKLTTRDCSFSQKTTRANSAQV